MKWWAGTWTFCTKQLPNSFHRASTAYYLKPKLHVHRKAQEGWNVIIWPSIDSVSWYRWIKNSLSGFHMSETWYWHIQNSLLSFSHVHISCRRRAGSSFTGHMRRNWAIASLQIAENLNLASTFSLAPLPFFPNLLWYDLAWRQVYLEKYRRGWFPSLSTHIWSHPPPPNFSFILLNIISSQHVAIMILYWCPDFWCSFKQKVL